MSGDCPECDRPLLWAGMSWEPHTDAQHALYRNTLLRTIARQLIWKVELRRWQDELLDRDEIGIHWHNGVFPYGIGEYYTNIPREAWENITPRAWAAVFRDQRAWLARMSWERHGVKVNPATWLHTVYDPKK